MAGIYAPIITNYPQGVITTVSSTGTSYEQILNSMGSFVYEVSSMYIQSNAIEQVLQPLRFSQYDVNGTLQSYSQITTVDPFQAQSSINFDLAKEDVVLQGRTTLNTQILASEQLNVILYVKQLSNKSLLEGSDIFSQDDFFKDYTPQLDDSSDNLLNSQREVSVSIPNLKSTAPLKSKKTSSSHWIVIVGSIILAGYVLVKTKK